MRKTTVKEHDTMKKDQSSKPTPSTSPVHGGKKPSDPREYPAARDSRGTSSRQEIRAHEAKVSAPRQSQRTPERGNQSRKHR